MRVLHVLDHSAPLHSGYAFRTLAILEHQRALGWQTVHVTSAKQTGAAQPREEASGFTFHRTLTAASPLDRIPVVDQVRVIQSLRRRIDEVVRETKPDIVHAHSPCRNAMAALPVARRWSLPLVYEIRGLWEDSAVSHRSGTPGGWRYQLSRAMETRMVRRADAVTVLCEGLRREIVARGVPDRRVTVVPNGVDLTRFSTDGEPDLALAQSLGLAGASVVGFIGSFYRHEGLSLLIGALPRILERRGNVRLLLVGGGPEEQDLRRQAAAAGVADRVVFTGRVPHDDVARYYRLTDVLVYPRPPMRLTDLVTPLKPLEAMAQGRLVVASDVGGHRELIHDGETGFLFKAGDGVALAATVLSVLDQGARTATVKTAARRFVEQERTWAASTARYGPVYAGLLDASVQDSHVPGGAVSR